MQPGNARIWANQSHSIASALAYGHLPVAPVCGVTGPQTLALDARYAEVAGPVVRQQLARASARLAATINSIYGQSH
jgi:hypothetical protein